MALNSLGSGVGTLSNSANNPTNTGPSLAALFGGVLPADRLSKQTGESSLNTQSSSTKSRVVDLSASIRVHDTIQQPSNSPQIALHSSQVTKARTTSTNTTALQILTKALIAIEHIESTPLSGVPSTFANTLFSGGQKQHSTPPVAFLRHCLLHSKFQRDGSPRLKPDLSAFNFDSLSPDDVVAKAQQELRHGSSPAVPRKAGPPGLPGNDNISSVNLDACLTRVPVSARCHSALVVKSC